MNKYTKPKFNMAFLDPISLNASGCATVATPEDAEVMDMLYPGIDWQKEAFGSNEDCTIEIEGLCKFNSGLLTGASGSFMS